MLIIRKNQLNKLVVTASQNRSLPNPYYLFAFTHILSREEVNFVGYMVSSNTRYDQFELIESPVEDLSLTPPLVTFPYLGQYYYEIYEQNSSTNTDPSLATNEVENGRAYIIVKNDNETECLYEQYISPNETNQNIIFISESEEVCLTPEPTVTMTQTPTSTVTSTATSTPTQTPTMTMTPTPSATCPITTQYLEVELSENTRFRLVLWNQPNFTSPANALCDYVISGVAYGSLGTIYYGQETILSGQHQHQFDLAPVLQPGEIVQGFAVLSYSATTCVCPVNVIYPENLWVAGGTGNAIGYSYDGLTWQASNSANTIFAGAGGLRVATNGNTWIAGANGTLNSIGYSTDGITWSATTNGNLIFGVGLTSRVFGIGNNGSLWVAGGQNTTNILGYSSDGLVWSASTNGNSIFTSIESVAWNGSIWVAGGFGINTLGYSSDGITWSGSTNGNSIFNVRCYEIAWNGSIWVAGGQGTNTLAYSTDGLVWSATTNGNSIITSRVESVAWNGNLWVAGGTGTNTLAYSTDGLVWSASTNGNSIFTQEVNDVAWNGSIWLAGGTGTNEMAYSMDGITWSGNTGGNTVFQTSVTDIASKPAPNLYPPIA